MVPHGSRHCHVWSHRQLPNESRRQMWSQCQQCQLRLQSFSRKLQGGSQRRQCHRRLQSFSRLHRQLHQFYLRQRMQLSLGLPTAPQFSRLTLLDHNGNRYCKGCPRRRKRWGQVTIAWWRRRHRRIMLGCGMETTSIGVTD